MWQWWRRCWQDGDASVGTSSVSTVDTVFQGRCTGDFEFSKVSPCVCGPVLGTLSFQMFSLFVCVALTEDVEFSNVFPVCVCVGSDRGL